MTKYFIKQVAWSAVKLFLFITFMFFFIQIVMPGDFITQFSLGCNAACRARMRAQLGLDLPLWKRYFHWLGQIVTLDLGNSMSGKPVIDILKGVIPPTLLVFLTGTMIAFLIGSWLGKVTAWSKWGLPSRLVTLGGLTLFTSFPPWLAWLVTYAVGRGAGFVVMGEIGGLRQVSFQNLDRELWQGVEIEPNAVIMKMLAIFFLSVLVFAGIKRLLEQVTKTRMQGIVFLILIPVWTVAGWDMLGIATYAFDIMRLAYLPLLTYILLSFGETMLIMQASLREVKKSEYIKTARAKGLPDSLVRDRHAVRNAILPVLSRLVISLPYLLTGVVIIESSLDWPGMGTNMWNSLYWQNMPVVMNTLLLVGILSLAARLILDILGAYLDPRIRHRESKVNIG
mgnify:CR=1 FL=1